MRFTTSKNAGRFLLDADAGLLDFAGQSRQCQIHAVLHEHLGHVKIRADFKRDRQVVAAVVGGLRAHVEHVFHADHLLLDRRGDGFGHDFAAGPGIGAGHLHRRRRNFRILRHRQQHHGDAARQRDHDRDHGGKNWPFDKELRHGATPLRMPFSRALRHYRETGSRFKFVATLSDSDVASTFCPGRTRCNPLTIT